MWHWQKAALLSRAGAGGCFAQEGFLTERRPSHVLDSPTEMCCQRHFSLHDLCLLAWRPPVICSPANPTPFMHQQVPALRCPSYLRILANQGIGKKPAERQPVPSSRRGVDVSKVPSRWRTDRLTNAVRTSRRGRRFGGPATPGPSSISWRMGAGPRCRRLGPPGRSIGGWK